MTNRNSNLKNFFALAVVSFLASSSAFAASDENVMVMKKNQVVLEHDSSAANRLHKKVTLAAELSGMGPGLITGTGLSAGYFLNRNQVILAEYKGGKIGVTRRWTTYSNGVENVAESEGSGTSVGVYFKQFFGNSFYIKPGVDVAKVNYEFSPKSTAFGNYRSEFEATTVGANFSIGNQWQWENFTLGCDWIGLRQAISRNFSKDSIVGNFSAQDKADFEKDKDLFTKGSPLALRFYLGASF